MRKTISGYLLAVCILTSVAVPVLATPSRSGGDSLFLRLKRMIVHILDDAKLVIPPG